MKGFHHLFHSIAYYLAWFSCIILAARGYAWLSSFIVIVCVLLQIYWQYKMQHTYGLLYLLGLLVFISTLIDSALISCGVIVFAANPFAPFVTSPWMIALWISFTVILYATLDKLFNHFTLLGLLSFVGFALAYAGGAKMGAAFFPYGYKTCFFIGGIWLILLPCIIYCYKKIMDIKLNVIAIVFFYLVLQMCFVWIVYRLLKNPSVVDASWSIGLMMSGLIYVGSMPITSRTTVVSALLTLWALRLAGYLWYTRIYQGHIDKRYTELSNNWKINQSLGFFLNFQLQGLLIFIISFLFYLISNSNNSSLTHMDGIAIGMVIVGVMGETVADLQLYQFKNRQKGEYVT